MSISAARACRLHRLSLPGAMLVALLQRTPVLRVTAVAEEALVTAAPGAVLRAAVATAASLGVLHTLAGATQLVVSTTAVNGIVGTPITPVAFRTTGAPTVAQSYTVTGTLPPGLAFTPAPGTNGILNVTNAQGSGTITGTPTAAGNFTVTLKAWEFVNAQGNSSSPVSVLFTISSGTISGQPSITTQPLSQITAVGESVTFSAGVIANPAPTYQWFKNSVAIPSATSSSLTFASVLLADAGNYFVSITNAFGTVQSAAATLTVNAAPEAPRFITQPQAQTIATGSTVVFTGAASGAPAPAVQWLRGPTPIAGATSPTLVLSGTSAIGGTYTLTAFNNYGTVASNPATLTVVPATNSGRLINLSILTELAARETMTMGTVLGGAGTNPTAVKSLLARAAGPSLGVAPFFISAFLPDPTMILTATTPNPPVTIDTNNDWGGRAILTAAFASVAAFPFVAPTSKDAALLEERLLPGNYTVQVSDVGGAAGTVIAELYDETAPSTFTAATPRLINVSVRKQIAAGTTLTAGFYIDGATARTVLVRAIGPGLAQFGLGGFMVDPRVALYNAAGRKIAENDNWGGDPQLTAAGTAVAAFKIENAASTDAMLLITLAPGSYTAQVSGTGAGEALVEVYEVP